MGEGRVSWVWHYPLGSSVGGRFVGGDCVFCLVAFSVGSAVAVDSGNGVLVGEGVMVLARVGGLVWVAAIGAVVVSSGTAISAGRVVGLGMGDGSMPSSSLKSWKRSSRINKMAMRGRRARFIGRVIFPQKVLPICPIGCYPSVKSIHF